MRKINSINIVFERPNESTVIFEVSEVQAVIHLNLTNRNTALHFTKKEAKAIYRALQAVFDDEK